MSHKKVWFITGAGRGMGVDFVKYNLSVLVRIAGFIVLVLLAIGFFIVGLVVAVGAPHAFAPSPGLGIAFIAVGVSCAAAAVVLLRRTARSIADSPDAGRLTRNRVYLIAAGALALVVGVIVFPYVYEPRSPARGSTAVGAYLVEPTLTSSCAVNAHRVFYKGRVVTRVAALVMVSPHDPSRLLYTVACANNGDESGTWYYGGGANAPVQANPLTLYESGPWLDAFWSPDDRYVVVPVQGKETLVNLETGRRSQFLDDVFAKRGAFSSGVHFRGWSPDGRRFAMMIGTSHMNDDRSFTRTAELVSVDADTMEPTSIATKADEWQDGEFTWTPAGSTYELTAQPRA